MNVQTPLMDEPYDHERSSGIYISFDESLSYLLLISCILHR